MPEVFLRYGGLKPDQRSWYYNRRGRSVEIRPGDWVRLDLNRHPEVRPAIQAGTATIEHSAPPDLDILDESSCADREANPYGKAFSRPSTRRQRSRGRPQVFELSQEQLEVVARRFLPWPGWQRDLGDFSDFSEDRPHSRGARPSVSLPPEFERNFVVLHRIAELISRGHLEECRAIREREIESGWASGEYLTKSQCRKYYQQARPLPRKNKLVVETLHRWGIWKRSNAPSSKTLKHYRAMLGADFPVRACVDEQILDASKEACQRIIEGPAIFQVGPYVPDRAASPALTVIGHSVGWVIQKFTRHENGSPSINEPSPQKPEIG